MTAVFVTARRGHVKLCVFGEPGKFLGKGCTSEWHQASAGSFCVLLL